MLRHLLACLLFWPAVVLGSGLDPLLGGKAEGGFLRVEQAYQAEALKEDGQLLLRWRAAPGHYLYRHGFRYVLDGQPLVVTLPEGITKHDEYFGEVQVYYGEVAVSVPLPAGPAELTLTSQGCADAGLCYPPYTVHLRYDPATGLAEPVAAPLPAPGPQASGALWLVALAALAGGLLLNLMPCVFPVLALKAMSFAGASAESRHHHAGAYTVGVLLSFLLVAGLLLALRSAGQAVGWGFQLQSPWFVGVLAYLFVAIGLALSGVVEFGSRWMGVGSEAAASGGLKGSFFTGVLAVVVASPCTGPFMAGALGVALVQPPVVALTLFACLGLGMALPVLLFALLPQTARWLPRPGQWMVTLRGALAFPLYASALWLLWVLGRQTGVDGLATALVGCLLLALALWCWGQRHAFQVAGRRVAMVVALAGVAGALALLASPPVQERAGQAAISHGWEPYSAARLASLRAAGTPVLINVTADWCLTCKLNERILALDSVDARLREAGVVRLLADWTHQDPAITALLAEHGRSGVPLYVWYPEGAGSPPRLLPQLLTPGLLTALPGRDGVDWPVK